MTHTLPHISTFVGTFRHRHNTLPSSHPNPNHPKSLVLDISKYRTHTDTHSHLSVPRVNRDQGLSGWKDKFHWIKWEIIKRATLNYQQIQTDGWSLINIWANVWGQKGVKSGKRSGKEWMEGEMLEVIKRWCKICIRGHHRWAISARGPQERQCSTASNEYQSRRRDGVL